MKFLSPGVILLLGFPFSVLAQPYFVLPQTFEPFQTNIALMHPAATCMVGPFSIGLGYKTQTNAFAAVNSNFFNLNIRSKTRDSLSSQFHGWGAAVINDREGEYFSRNRMNLTYAWHRRLSNQWYLAGGAMVGAIYYNYKASDVYPGGTAFKPNIDVGFIFYDVKESFGALTIGQIWPGNLAPLESQQLISTYLALTLRKKWRLDPHTYVALSGFYRQLWADGNYTLQFNGMGYLFRFVALGGGYKWNQGFSLIGGFTLPVETRYHLDIYFSYYLPASIGNNLIVPTFEINCLVKRK